MLEGLQFFVTVLDGQGGPVFGEVGPPLAQRAVGTVALFSGASGMTEQVKEPGDVSAGPGERRWTRHVSEIGVRVLGFAGMGALVSLLPGQSWASVLWTVSPLLIAQVIAWFLWDQHAATRPRKRRRR
ncbi:hypothetical protein GCM10009535_55200 [Streptomyces thermocarboxydovorans]|uniref:Uncharacterized protein n=1 Tax=Streptomyces thermocarboxydovorans TaxID=59298 RepID=A0ABN1HUP4_9ACTN